MVSKKALSIAAAGVSLALLVFAVGQLPVWGQADASTDTSTSERSVTVSAQGSISAQPDVA